MAEVIKTINKREYNGMVIRSATDNGTEWFMMPDVCVASGLSIYSAANLFCRVSKNNRKKMYFDMKTCGLHTSNMVNAAGVIESLHARRIYDDKAKAFEMWFNATVNAAACANTNEQRSIVCANVPVEDCVTDGFNVFENSQFGKVRTVARNGEPWFVGKDVAERLGYSDTSDALKKHVDDDDKGVGEMQTPGGKQKIIIINESGLYSLVLSSKLPEAKVFKRWVTSEVIPAIRKTGGYIAGEKEMSDEELLARALIMADRKIKERDAALVAKNAEVGRLTVENEALIAENSALAMSSLKWSNKAFVTAAIKKYAKSIKNGKTYVDKVKIAWWRFKREMLYVNGINMSARLTDARKVDKNATALGSLDDTEIAKCAQLIVAMCRTDGVDLTEELKHVDAEIAA